MVKHFHAAKYLWMSVFIAGLLSACSNSRDTVQDIQGKTYNLEQPGYWTLINYWAFWCKPCRKEVPELNEFAAANPNTVRIWAVNFDGVQGEELKKEAEQLGFRFPVLVDDPGAHWQVEKPNVLPTTVVIQPDGRLHSVLYGPQTLESLNRLIANASNPHEQPTLKQSAPKQSDTGEAIPTGNTDS